MEVTAKKSKEFDGGCKSFDIPLKVRQEAARQATEATLEYLKEHSPVRTGLLKASWKINSAKGYRINRDTITISIKNDAHEIRNGEPHYYQPYVENGFHHVWQNGKWHPGRHDVNKAGEVAKDVVKKVIGDHLKSVIEDANHPKKYIVDTERS